VAKQGDELIRGMDGYEEGCVAKNRDDCQIRGMSG
jgi:hypothetical protein